MRWTTSLCGVQPDDRVAERDDEGLPADKRSRAEDGVAEPEHVPLPGVEVLQGRALERELLEQFLLAGLAQRLDQLGVQIEVVLDRRLAGPGDEQHAPHPDARQLLDDVLHDRLAPDRQHLLGLRLGGRQQPGAEAGDGDDGNVDGHGRVLAPIHA